MSLSVVWTTAAILLLTTGFASPPALPHHVAPNSHVSVGVPRPGDGLPGHLPNNHIEHVITIMLENHAYDSYFGTYCQVLGPYCSVTGNGIPDGTCIPYYPSAPWYGCVAPFDFTPAELTIGDMAHDWYSGPLARDNGAMDRFYEAEGTTNSFGHYNATTIPIYWDMAEQYASGDNFWGANLSWSLPNHWYLIAGTEPRIAYDRAVGFYGFEPNYLAQANNTSSVEDLLNHSSVSWKYYDTVLEPYGTAIQGSGIWGTAYDLWNPMAARAVSYGPAYASHFVDRSDFLYDVRHGGLPNVSWIIPDFWFSDHPGANTSSGEAWIAQLVNAVELSPYWNSTAIFITWDDYGGWYDHVPPPTILGDVLSFRAPILVISPYAKENYISHVQTNFMSLLRYVEWQFGLGCLRPMDCFAPLPLDFFDFTQQARSPIVFGTTWDTATYPMPLQQGGPMNFACDACRTWEWPNPLVGNMSSSGSTVIDYS